MKILFFHGTYPKYGGTEKNTTILSNMLAESGYEVFISSLEQHDMELISELDNRVKLVFLPDKTDLSCDKNIQFLSGFISEKKISIIINQGGSYCIDFTYNLKTLTGAGLISVLHFQPDFTLLKIRDHLIYTSLFGNGIKTTVKKMILPLYMKYQHIILKRINTELYSKSDILVLLSGKFIELFGKLTGISDLGKLRAIANPNVYNSTMLPEEILLKKKQILYVGRLSWYDKRVDRLLNVWEKLFRSFPDWSLRIVGDGPERENLERMASENKLERIHFEGQQDPLPYYRESSILCLTSTHEGFGLVLTEAQQMGVAPISFLYTALPDIIEDGISGVIVKPFDVDIYAEKLAQLMDNDQYRHQIAQHAMESSKKFSKEKICSEWIKIFESLN